MNRQRIWLVALHRFYLCFFNDTFLFVGFIGKSSILSVLACAFKPTTFAIIITSGNDTPKVVGLKAHAKTDKIDDFCQNIRQDFDIY